MQVRIKCAVLLLNQDTSNGVDIVSVPIKKIDSSKYNPQFDLTLIAIFKNEGPYLREWINYYLLQGVQHFFLYDNGSTDDSHDVLSEFDSSLLSIIPWPDIFGNGGQTLALAHGIGMHRLHTKWVIHCDIDEFIFTTDGTKIIEKLLVNDHINCYVLPWRCFGTSGLKSKPIGKVTESYIHMADLSRANDNLKYELTRTKAIYQPHLLESVHVHNPKIKGISVTNSEEFLLNHYITRSEEDFYEKLNRAHPWSEGKLLNSWRDKRLAIFNFLKDNYVEDKRILNVNKHE